MTELTAREAEYDVSASLVGPQQPGAAAGPVNLLIISDQKGSSGNCIDDIKANTKEHFSQFVSLLRSFKAENSSTFIIKNVGDSLMIRVECAAVQVGTLLHNIIRAQRELCSRRLKSRKIEIRVVVFLLSDGCFIDGDEIEFSIAEYDKVICPPMRRPRKLPGKEIRRGRTRRIKWLSGDLFGPNVSLAFRAAQMPSKPFLVIDDNAAKKVWSQHGGPFVADGPFVVNVPGCEVNLAISEKLAFSPVKGMERLYRFGQASSEDAWPGHLYLRAVSFSNDEHHHVRREFALEQQKSRVFFRLMCNKPPQYSSGRVTSWVSKVLEIDADARYIRAISAVRGQWRIWRHGRDEQNRVQPMHVALTPAPDNSAAWTEIVLAFAGPSEDAIRHVRNKFEEYRRDRKFGDGFLYPLSSVVYTDKIVPEEGELGGIPDKLKNFWSSDATRSSWHILAFARWVDPHRRGPAEKFVDTIEPAMFDLGLSADSESHGLIMGGEWDVYAYFFPDPAACPVVPDPGGPGIQKLLNALDGLISENQIAEITMFLCENKSLPRVE